MNKAKELLNMISEGANCSNYRKDTETCKSGCKKIEVNAGDACPFMPEVERSSGGEGGEYHKDCPCYS